MKNKLDKIFSVLIIIYSLCAALIQLLKSTFYGELAISFLPYIFFSNLLLLIIYISFLIYKKLKLQLNKLNLYSLVILLLISIIYFLPLYNFSFRNNENNKAQTSRELKIAFFNKYAGNNSYKEIGDYVNKLDPDIIGFAELTSYDAQNISNLEKYKYSYVPDCNCKFQGDGVALYSKFPIKNSEYFLWDISPSMKSTIEIDSKEYEVLVVHTTAPINKEYKEFRSKQMDNITKIISESSNDFIIMGDFNISPWSPDYSKFINENKQIINTAKGKGLKFTWQYRDIKLLQFMNSQIDHIFVSNNIGVRSFNVGESLNSDHKFIWTEVGI